MREKSKIPQQKRAIQTKKHIIETAIVLFSDKGFYNTSTNEISKTAGVSIGSFYSHFNDKKQLFLEAFSYYSTQIECNINYNLVLDYDSKEKAITEFIQSVFKAHKTLPEFHQEVTAMCLLDPEIKKIVSQQNSQKFEQTYHLLEYWQSEIKVSDLHVASFFIYSILENIIHKSIYEDTDFSEDRLTKELVDIILNYLF